MNHSLFVLRGMGFSRLPELHKIVRKLKQLEDAAPLQASLADPELRMMERRVASWDGIAVLAYFDEPTSTWIFIALHDATLGMTAGGCRVKIYGGPLEGLTDAMRLAEAMTSKWAVIGFSFGGGKAVLCPSRTLSAKERVRLLQRFGQLLESLEGIYQTGEDLGTNSADMAIVARTTGYAHGFHLRTGEPVQSGYYTASGVKVGIETALRHVYGEPNTAGRKVLIQGVGDVGSALARMLADDQAEIFLSDIDRERVLALSEELGCRVLSTEEVYTFPVDVYAPCAVGGTLNPNTVKTLGCRIVAGSANNQLSADAIADTLYALAILYVPDFVINAGGAIALSMFHLGASEREVLLGIAGIARTLEEVFAEAGQRGESAFRAALRRVQSTLKRPDHLPFGSQTNRLEF
jgi:glutamate dehydrogenase/leucine dehydrogenase